MMVAYNSLWYVVADGLSLSRRSSIRRPGTVLRARSWSCGHQRSLSRNHANAQMWASGEEGLYSKRLPPEMCGLTGQEKG